MRCYYNTCYVSQTIGHTLQKKLLTSYSHFTPSLSHSFSLSHTFLTLTDNTVKFPLADYSLFCPLFLSHVHFYSTILSPMYTTTSFILFLSSFHCYLGQRKQCYPSITFIIHFCFVLL